MLRCIMPPDLHPTPRVEWRGASPGQASMGYREFADLLRAAAVNWVRDYAQSMGAALAFYTMFSIAPLLLIVVSVAGLVVGEDAARGEIYSQLDGMLGSEGALAVQGLLEAARRPAGQLLPGVIGLVVLFVGATTVFAELQDALDRIWRAPARPAPAAATHGLPRAPPTRRGRQRRARCASRRPVAGAPGAGAGTRSRRR